MLVFPKNAEKNASIIKKGLVSIQISKNLGKTFLRISCLRKFAVTWILVTGFAYLPSFFSQILSIERF